MEIINNDEGIKKFNLNLNFQKFKVCLMGIDNSGKSTFLNRIDSINNFKKFKESIKVYTPTDGVSFFSIFIKYKGKLFHLDVWDCSGQERYSALVSYFQYNALAILNFYDPFNKKSFELIKKNLEILKELNNKYLCCYIIIKSKCDLNETKDRNIMISDEEVLEFADKNNLLFRNLSNLEKYGSGIEEIIEDIINAYLHKNNKN